MCLFSNEDNQNISRILCCICFMVLSLFIMLLKKSMTMVKRMTQPTPNAIYKETYCILSLYMLYVLQIMTICSVFKCFCFLVELLMGDNYKTYFYTDLYASCLSNQTMWQSENISFASVFFFIDQVVVDTIYSWCDTNLILLQIFEWASILFIIKTQRARRVEEILYEHNNEVLDQPLILF